MNEEVRPFVLLPDVARPPVRYRDAANEISTEQRFGLIELPPGPEPNPFRDLTPVGR